MMKKLKFALVACLTVGIGIGISACSSKEEPVHVKSAEEQRAEHMANAKKNEVLQNTLEQTRSTAYDNVARNVANYFAINPRFNPASDWSVIPHTDDYIDSACPSGSGWGWANIMNPKLKNAEGQPTKFKVFCSTTSASLGCYIENDFKQSPHAKNAGKCNPDLPFPLKSISK